MRLLKIAIPCAVLLSGYASLATQGSGEAATPSIEPGQWEMTLEMTSVEAPGAPEELLRHMRASMAEQRQVQSQCITPEQARNPSADLMGSQNPAGCEFSDTTWSGGNIHARALCSPPEGPPVQLAIDGSYDARRIDSRLDIIMDLADAPGAETPVQIRLGGRMTGRRTGDCRRPPPEPRPNENSVAPMS